MTRQSPSQGHVYPVDRGALAARIKEFLPPLASPQKREPVDERPGCAYGTVTRQKVADLADVITRVETKLNAILGGVLVALILEIIRSWRP